MKYPLPPKCHLLAMEYVTHSFDYTLNDFNEKNPDKRAYNILTGQIAQFFFFEWYKLNSEYPIKMEPSSFDKTDKYDLKISTEKREYVLDVKATTRMEFAGQVNAIYKNKAIDYFIFSYIDKDLQWIEPLGIVSKGLALKKDFFIPYNTIIPGTNTKNRFPKGSYFVPRKDMTALPISLSP